jgi:hypothetical protein
MCDKTMWGFTCVKVGEHTGKHVYNIDAVTYEKVKARIAIDEALKKEYGPDARLELD